MATPIGVTGGVAVVPEGTYGVDPASGYVRLHGVSATLGLRRSLITPSFIQRTAYGDKVYGPSYVDGEITGDFTYEGDVMLPLLRNIGTVAVATATIDGGAPTTTSLHIEVNYGGTSYKFGGCVATGFRLEGQRDGPVRFTVPIIGQSMTKDTSPESLTTPSSSLVVLPSTLGAMRIGGTACLFNSFSINVEIPHSGADRAAYAGAAIKQPIRLPGCRVSGSIEVELDDTSGANTISVLDSFIAGTSLAAIDFGTTSIVLADCRMVGDHPAWTGGITNFPINFEADSLVIVTT